MTVEGATEASLDGTGFPYNKDLHALNVHVAGVPASAIARAREVYKDAVAPELWSTEPGDLVSGGTSTGGAPATLYVTAPPLKAWGYEIRWVYASDAPTWQLFEELFDACGIRQHFEDVDEVPRGFQIRRRRKIQLYAGSFVIRKSKGLTKPFFHEDFNPRCGREAYTFMSPLYDMDDISDGQLVYHDMDGKQRQYQYKMHESIQFGAKFMHATEPCSTDEERAFLCFNFGTDDPGESWFDSVGNLPLTVLDVATRFGGLDLPEEYPMRMRVRRAFQRANVSGNGHLTLQEFETFFGGERGSEARMLVLKAGMAPYYVFQQLCGDADTMTETEFDTALSGRVLGLPGSEDKDDSCSTSSTHGDVDSDDS